MSAPRLRLINRPDVSTPVPNDGGEPALPDAVYEFGPFRLFTADKQVLRAGKPVPLRPKLYETLLILVQNPGRLVEKEVFFKRLWPDCFVDEAALAQNISKLRKSLESPTDERSYIETVSKRGYRFRVPVKPIDTEPPEAPSQVTLAVLPFENLGAGPEREYLADGLTEEVITALGRIDPENLRVIGRTSMIAYKCTAKSLAEIGRELGAAYLVESSIRAEGARIRIVSKLIRVHDQVQIWSSSYDGEPASMLEFQRELSMTIANEVRRRFSPERLEALARRQTQQAEAYDLYLRGRYFWEQFSPQTTKRAMEYYARATEFDPEYALAWSGLADAYSAAPNSGDADPLQMLPLASAAVERALRSGPDLVEVLHSVGLVKFWHWDWSAAEAALKKAVAIDPNYALAHRTLGLVVSHRGQHERARAELRRTRELESICAQHLALSSQIEFNARDFEAAIAFAHQATTVDPEFWIGYMQLAQAYAQTCDNGAAFAALNKAARFSSNSKLIALRGYLSAKLGRITDANAALEILEAASQERHVPPYATALVHAGMNNRDLALEWLERAYEARDVHLLRLLVDPKWDTLRGDPRFGTLLARCGMTTDPTDPKPST